jgi:hypothetical protein
LETVFNRHSIDQNRREEAHDATAEDYALLMVRPQCRRSSEPLHALWRAVDAEGEVLDVLVQTRRNKRAALKLMRKLLKKYGFVPDKLRNYSDDAVR